jgi:glycosyltransferase involved in cell wall biosynthesis
MRFPHWYPVIDRRIYRKKTVYSCLQADRIVAISRQTKSDIIEFYRIDKDRINVVYQGCDPIFSHILKKKEIKMVLSKYNLPSQYMLYVGTIEERKNLLGLITAIEIGSIDIPLVVVGRPTAYADKVKSYITRKSIENILFLDRVPSRDLPALYQKAMLFIYPSQFEGFGLPILEALTSGTPVITSKGSCFSEAGGKHTLYVDPSNIDELSDAIDRVLSDSSLRNKMIEKGLKYAGKFNQEAMAHSIMKVYEKALNG